MLKVVTRSDAAEIIRKSTRQLVPDTQIININDSLGRIVSEDIAAAEDVPPFDRSTVDGFAVCAADTFGAGEAVPAELECVERIKMGRPADFKISRGQCADILTGGMMPEGSDAVVMIENTFEEYDRCLVYSGAAPGENVTAAGSDIAKGCIAVKKGTVITPAVTGILAALGIYEVPVFKKPVIAVISTGDEIVNADPSNGQIRDINTYLLNACAKKAGCDTYIYGAVKDDRNLIEKAVDTCLKKADAVIISGGSSAGNADMTCSILGGLGKVFFHGIAVKPGKPSIFAMADGKPVFGLPGHPLAAYFVFRLFIKEYLNTILALPEDRPAAKAKLLKNIPSNHGREEFVCVKIGGGYAEPLYTKSGIISVLSRADGFVCIPRESEGIDAGTEVNVYGL